MLGHEVEEKAFHFITIAMGCVSTLVWVTVSIVV